MAIISPPFGLFKKGCCQLQAVTLKSFVYLNLCSIDKKKWGGKGGEGGGVGGGGYCILFLKILFSRE